MNTFMSYWAAVAAGVATLTASWCSITAASTG